MRSAPDLDCLVHAVVSHTRGVLGHTGDSHTWYRIALTSANKGAGTCFDDLTQVWCVPGRSEGGVREE